MTLLIVSLLVSIGQIFLAKAFVTVWALAFFCNLGMYILPLYK
ncbi:hypothetical protein [Leptospira jelokensis]|nr:hypothetical protein [Leptospira jelokensis]